MEDRFNDGMSGITHFVFLYVVLRRLQISLTFSRHQMMYNVFYVVLCAKVIYKGYSVVQQQCKEQNQALDPWSFQLLLQIYDSFPS